MNDQPTVGYGPSGEIVWHTDENGCSHWGSAADRARRISEEQSRPFRIAAEEAERKQISIEDGARKSFSVQKLSLERGDERSR